MIFKKPRRQNDSIGVSSTKLCPLCLLNPCCCAQFPGDSEFPGSLFFVSSFISYS